MWATTHKAPTPGINFMHHDSRCVMHVNAPIFGPHERSWIHPWFDYCERHESCLITLCDRKAAWLLCETGKLRQENIYVILCDRIVTEQLFDIICDYCVKQESCLITLWDRTVFWLLCVTGKLFDYSLWQESCYCVRQESCLITSWDRKAVWLLWDTVNRLWLFFETSRFYYTARYKWCLITRHIITEYLYTVHRASIIIYTHGQETTEILIQWPPPSVIGKSLTRVRFAWFSTVSMYLISLDNRTLDLPSEYKPFYL